MDNKKNGIPKLRFPGFTGAWEQRKLGEVFNQTLVAINPEIENVELWSLTIEDGLTHKTARYNRQFLVKKEDNFKKVFPGDIVYNPMNMTLGAVGFNYMDIPVAVSGYYVTMQLNKNYDNCYFAVWLKSPIALSLYKRYATGSLTEKQRVQFSTLSTIPAVLPGYKEQQKIGAFFQQLDSLITLHQRKLEHLQEQKKGLLQKMFPKNGENVPEVRFPGFTDAWEQRKLGEVIVSEHKGKVKSSMKGGNTNYLETNYLNGGTAQKVDAIADVSKDDVLILWDGSKAGTIYHGFEGALGSTLKAYVPKYSGDFLYQILKKNQDKIYQSYRTPNIPHVIKNFTEKFNVSIPTIIEQQEIGDFFKQLDSLITLHQRKLEHLELMKKGLLQQMFV